MHVVLEPLRLQDGCEIVLREDVSRGPFRFLPRPLRTAMIKPRNRESLRRLALIAEGMVRNSS